MSEGWIGVLELVIITYFVLLNTVYLGFMVVGFLDLRSYWRRVLGHDFRGELADITYRPVSILVPALDESDTIVDNVRSLLQLGYPEFEVVVINDGSSDDTLERLIREFGLVAVPRTTRIRLEAAPVRRVYRSLDHPILQVLDLEEHAGKSRALNAGINASRYPLFCTIDADSLLEPDALLRIARAFVEDERIVAAGGIVRVLEGAVSEAGKVVANRVPDQPLAVCQSVEYVRGFLTGRAALSRLDALLIVAGAFALFRKEAVIEAGGYSPSTVCEDMELIVRLHRIAREEEREGKVIFVPDPVCWTRVPEDWGALIHQRDRWQRGMLESLWRHRRMFLNPRYGSVGMIGMPYYVLFEALAPLVEISGYLLFLALFLAGSLNPVFATTFIVLAVFLGMLLSVGALNLDDFLFRRYASARDLAKMMSGAVLEFVGYRQLLVAVRALAFVTVFGRRRRWGKRSHSHTEVPEREASA